MKPRSLDRRLAKQVPENVFDSPLCIVDERLLTKGEKIATLDRWRQSALSQANSTARNLVLGQIEEAKIRLAIS